MTSEKTTLEPEDEDDEEESEVVSADDLKALFRFLSPFARPYRGTFILLAALVLIEAGLNFSFPLVTQYLIDEGLIKRNGGPS